VHGTETQATRGEQPGLTCNRLPPTLSGQTIAVDQKEDAARMSAGDTAQFHLPNDETAAGQARRDVRLTFTRWRLATVIEDAALAVSELVTNAVRHGLPPIGLRLRRRVGQVRIDVNDARPEPVIAGGRPSDLSESGRGLGIVDAVADETGSEHIPGDGKFVYAAWNITSPAAGAGRLGDGSPPVATRQDDCEKTSFVSRSP
jgi:anti-sigma regulatory factor (Ser/Thr protein kinase)